MLSLKETQNGYIMCHETFGEVRKVSNLEEARDFVHRWPSSLFDEISSKFKEDISIILLTDEVNDEES